MKAGEVLKIARKQFQQCFPCGFPSIYDTHEQAFLSSMPGSAWGCYRVTYDPIEGVYIISKHKEENKRVYVDPDREHLYNFQDGEYVWKGA